MQKSNAQISLRLPQSYLDRADQLASWMVEQPEYRFVPRLSQSFVLKLAIERGLEALEADQRAKKAGESE